MRLISSALLGSIFLLIQLSLFHLGTTLDIVLTSSPREDVFQVFYDIGNGYQEAHSVRRTVEKKAYQVLSFPLPQHPIKHLRIDPGHFPGEVFIQSITLRYHNFFRVRTLVWTPEELLKDFAPLSQIDQFVKKDQVLYLHTTGRDPYFTIKYSLDIVDNFLKYLSILILGLALGIFFIHPLWKATQFLLNQFHQTFTLSQKFIYSAFIFVLALMMVVAITTVYNHHPDEHHHFVAAEYYITHWVPPEIGDPAVRHTYSVYGSSYLNYYWFEYLLMGKFMGLISPILIENPVVAARLFNIFLFVLLFMIYFHRAKHHEQGLIILFPVFMTPQIWYVFSYANNDAWPLFLSLLVMSEIVYVQSPLNKFLSDTQNKNIYGGIFFGLLSGLLLISKQNYYIVLLFIAMLFFFRVVHIESFKKVTVVYTLLRKLLFILWVASLVFITKYTLDMMINGESPYFRSFIQHSAESKLINYQEKTARDAFKPSVIKEHPEKSFFSLHLREKGLPYRELFSTWRWHDITFKSFVGYYGYMSIGASQTYYFIMGSLYIAFFLFLFFSILLKKEHILWTLGIGLAMLGAVFISSYHSWTVDFQAQGRYLFPVISLLGLLMYQNRQAFNQLVTHIFLLSLFGCSVYSFLFVALMNL